MTILRDATAINGGTTAIMAVSLRNHGDNGGATAVYAVQAPQWYRASGVTGVLGDRVSILNFNMETNKVSVQMETLVFAFRKVYGYKSPQI